jgi:hypothetical protein
MILIKTYPWEWRKWREWRKCTNKIKFEIKWNRNFFFFSWWAHFFRLESLPNSKKSLNCFVESSAEPGAVWAGPTCWFLAVRTDAVVRFRFRFSLNHKILTEEDAYSPTYKKIVVFIILKPIHHKVSNLQRSTKSKLINLIKNREKFWRTG